MRIMGLDVGERRIGIALSDPLMITAQPFETLSRKKEEADVAHIKKLALEKEVSVIVCGLPLNMNGTEGPQAEDTRRFAGLLANETGLAVEFIDERLTTKMAERSLIEGGMSREKRKGVIDQAAAVQILKTYMEKLEKR